VVLATGDSGSDITLSLDPDAATLWVHGYRWTEYEWSDEQRDELHDLESEIAAIQNGDAELFFRYDFGRLTFVGGRIAGHTISDDGPEAGLISLQLAPWKRRDVPEDQ